MHFVRDLGTICTVIACIEACIILWYIRDGGRPALRFMRNHYRTLALVTLVQGLGDALYWENLLALRDVRLLTRLGMVVMGLLFLLWWKASETPPRAKPKTTPRKKE